MGIVPIWPIPQIHVFENPQLYSIVDLFFSFSRIIPLKTRSSIRLWTANGDPIQELYGHTSFVYSLDVLPTGELVSSGEDRTVRIWNGGECVQTITQPAISIWCVKALQNGDIASGSNDGFARVFTRNPERYADEALLKVSFPFLSLSLFFQRQPSNARILPPFYLAIRQRLGAIYDPKVTCYSLSLAKKI